MAQLSEPEKIRYSRHLLLEEIGLAGQQKIKDARVLVVGAGGLGCPVVQYLTAAGVGRLGVMDNSEIDIANLQRQVFYSFNDIGKLKAIVASSKMRKMNPLTEITMLNQRLSYANALSIVCEFDIVVDCTDNEPSRYVINDACTLTGKPMIHGAIHKYEGQVSVFNYKNGPGYRCLHPEEGERRKAKEEREEERSKIKDQRGEEMGIYCVMPGIIGLMQVNETIKVITGTGKPLSGKLMVYNAFDNQYLYIDIQRNRENFDPDLIAKRFTNTDNP
jgi:molybdopterin/thiamine biosynthesis adenylyltransferase